ncbi:MAG: TVP38/TMEM64 family protein [Deltaproteobacteria bacterium]|nr:TVP38/TMEM64 family protein [Deltaproteobacteria bacterium]
MDRNTTPNKNDERVIYAIDSRSDADVSHPIEKPKLDSFFSIRKDLIFILVISLIILGLHLTPLRQFGVRAMEFSEGIKEYGLLAPLIFTCGVTILVCVGVPRLLLCPIGGMLFGFFRGLIYCMTGTMIAFYIVFLFVRWAGGDFIIRRYPKLNYFAELIGQGGIPAVILARQMPMHGMVVNLILGLSPVAQKDFLIGTAIGLLPEAIPFTLIGKGIKQGSLEKSAAYIVIAVAVFAFLWLWLKIWTEKKERRSMENSKMTVSLLF